MAGTKRSKPRESVWTLPYVLICASQFLAYSNGVMLNPVLPLYLTDLGESPLFIGTTIAAFSVSSVLIRPFIGNSVDRWSARGMFLLGALTISLSSWSYLLWHRLFLLSGRTVHGAGWAAINTAGATMASDHTPQHRRGEAAGYFSMMRSLATALMPAFGLWLVGHGGYAWAFIASGVLGLLAVSMSSVVRDKPREHAAASSGGGWGGLVDREVLLPSALHLLQTGPHPIITQFIVLYAKYRGIPDLAIFFVVLGFTSIAAQLLSRFSDRWGRARVIVAGYGISIIGVFIMMLATSLLTLVVGGIFWATGSALIGPATMALAFDRMLPGRRGSAMATYTLAFQISSGAGALLWGFTIERLGFEATFVGGIVVLLAGIALVGLNWKSASGGRSP